MENEDIYISFGDEIPEDQLRSQYGSIDFVPTTAPEMSFRLVLPKTWKQSASKPETHLTFDSLSPVAAFMANGTSIQILATLLPWEVNLVDWLEYQGYAREFTLLNLASGQTDYGQTIHAVAQSSDGAFLRIMVTGNGPQVFLLIGRMPEGGSDIDEETLGLAAASFQFIKHCNLKTRESFQAFADKDGLFQLIYPQSWSFQTMDSLRPEKVGVDFRIAGDADTSAYLRIEADARIPRSKSGLEQILKLTLEEIQEAGVEVNKLDALPVGTNDGLREKWLGTCKLPSGNGQVALLFRPAAQRWLSAVMLCPDKLANPLAWMRGKRAYEIAVASLTVPAVGKAA